MGLKSVRRNEQLFHPQYLDSTGVISVLLGNWDGDKVSDTMGTLRIDVELAKPTMQGRRALLQGVVVETASVLSWVPSALLELLGIERAKELDFKRRDGTSVRRSVGFAIVHAAGRQTIDQVVFGEPGDPVLIGTLTLSGLNVRIDPVAKKLVDAGPAPAAAAA